MALPPTSLADVPTKDAAIRAQQARDKLDAIWPVVYRLVVLLVLIFMIAPLISILIISLSSAPHIAFPPPGYTLDQYTRIPSTLKVTFLRSLRLASVVATVDIVLCVPAAFALVRGALPGRSIIEAFFRSPLQIPGIVMAVGFYQYYSVLMQGTPIHLRGNFSGLVVAHSILTAPYMVTAVATRLYGVSRSLEEASYGLGAGFGRTMWRVVLPQIKPALIAGAFLAFVVSFEDVPVALFLAPSVKQTTLPVQMFYLALDSLSPALFAGAILVIVFFIFAMALMERLVGLRTFVNK